MQQTPHEQLNVLAYADGIVVMGKNETEIRQLLVEIENIARKLGLHINQGKTKYMIVEWENSSKQNKIGQLTIKNYTFERDENFKYLDLQERIKNANKILNATKINVCVCARMRAYVCMYIYIYIKLKLKIKNTKRDKTLIHASETWILTKREKANKHFWKERV